MILKVYIKRHMFPLPRKQNDLTELIVERLYTNKKLVKSAFNKMYNIDKVDNENIKIKKNTNIFLLNLFLLILQEKKEMEILVNGDVHLNNDYILGKIKEVINIDVTQITVEEIETHVLHFLYSSNKKKSDNEDKKNIKNDILKNIKFSINWVKKADSELKE